MSLFRPCIDLHDGKVKQIIGGTLDDRETPETNFVSEKSPAYYAGLYKQDNLAGGHIIRLGAGNDEAARSALAAWKGNLQIGGGITCKNAREWLDAGASHVIVTSAVFRDGIIDYEELDKLCYAVPADKLVLDLSCRKVDGKYLVVTDRWTRFTECEVDKKLFARLAGCCSEFLIHAVDVEGKCGGIDVELLELLAEYSTIPCVYAGGIRSFEDIRTIEERGSNKIAYTIGSALDIFGGSLSYREIADYSNRK
ncbi:MAG: phosphoribosylformimino-5-aminoimidazole carboxamide ribotide isomerase [Lentisphaeria bacterium]|nr:phosphoribosylformimino-5-aminoimidazole carboxamide ribotide isomerase [Lentisphaeria bacterium]MBQ7395363.1 phosphoribosylformimino-5-aminoimidazole carboxamide ribotide isomerase [Lentisphaeria bacterium]